MIVLEAKNLTKTFRSRTKTVEAVKGVSLSIEEGEILAFLGPNGAGKTTTIKMVAGLTDPDSGTVRIQGKDPATDPDVHAHIGAVLEGSRNVYHPISSFANLDYFGVLKGLSGRQAKRRSEELLEQFGLSGKRNTKVKELSRGMQQKLQIAVALIHNPKLLLLDEPTIGLDVEAAIAVKDQLRALADLGHSILLTTHQLDVAQDVADRVAIIRDGSIIAEEATSSLIERFSSDTYKIEFTGSLSADQIAALERQNTQVDGSTIHLQGSPEDLYATLEELKPLPLLRVEKGDTDLASIFLKLVKKEEQS